MADTKISALTAATTPLGGTEEIPAVQSSVTKKVTVANIQTAPVASGTANGVVYLNGSKVPTSGTALQFDGTNLGLGFTPSAWNSAYRTVDFTWASLSSENANQGAVRLNVNAYADSSGYDNWFRKSTAAATSYKQHDGIHSWFTAPSGAAGSAISFTQAMTLDASGNLMVGTTSPYSLGSSIKTFTVVGDSTARGGGWTLRTTDSSNVFSAWVADGNSNIGTLTATPLIFQANNTERARIDSSGNLLVGTTSSVGAALARVEVNGHASTGRSINTYSPSTAGITAISFNNPNGQVGSITTSGSSTAYNTSSDYRLKEDWKPMIGAIERVKLLKPVNFAWKASGIRVDGFLAHEAQEVSPEVATGNKDAMRDETYEASPATGDVFIPAIEEQYVVVREGVAAEPAYHDIDGNLLKPAVEGVEPAYEHVPAQAEQIIESGVVCPETLPEGAQWRETFAAVTAVRRVPDYQGIDQSKLVPLLTAALQETIDRLEKLETKIK